MICTEGSYDPAKIWRECSELEAVEAIKTVREFIRRPKCAPCAKRITGAV